MTPGGDACISCSTDRSVRFFKVPFAPLEAGNVEREVSAVIEFHGNFGFHGIDHHWQRDCFATAGERVRLFACISYGAAGQNAILKAASLRALFVVQLDIWEHSRSEPVNSFQWGSDTITAVRFNPAEPDILASCGTDRALALYDLRHSAPIRKLVLQASI